MGAVDDDPHTARAQLGQDALERKHQRRRRRDVVEDRDAGRRCHRSEDSLDDLAVGLGNPDPRYERRRAGFRTTRVDHEPHRVVRVIRDEDLVAGRERDRAQHRLDAERRILDERELPALRVHEGGDRRRGRPQRGRALARHHIVAEESVRCRLHPAANSVLLREDLLRACSEGAVVQEGRVVGELPEVANRAAVLHRRYRSAATALLNKSTAPKLPDLSTSPSPAPSREKSAGTPGSISGPISSERIPSAETTAPDVSPPATTRRFTPPATSPRATSAKKRSTATETCSMPCTPCIAATSDGVVVEKTNGSPTHPSTNSTAREGVSRPSRSAAMSTARLGKEARCHSTCSIVRAEQLPARIAAGPSIPRTSIRPPFASRRFTKFAGNPSATPDAPVMSGASAQASPMVRRSRSRTASTMTSRSPCSAHASSAWRSSAGPACTARLATKPTASVVWCRSQRRRSESVIGVSGWSFMLDSLSRRSPTNRCPW